MQDQKSKIMNEAFLNSYFHGGSSKFRDGYRIDTMKPELEAILNSLTISDKKGAKEFISNLVVSIFIHDTTYIKTNDLFILFKYFSVNRTLQLLQSNTIKIIDDNGLDIGLLVDANNKKFISFQENCYMYPDHTKAEHFNSSFEYLVFQANKAPIPVEIKNALLYNVERKTIFFDIDEIIEKIKKEMDYDLLNKNITDYLNINPNQLEETEMEKIGGLFSLARDNQAMLYSAILKTDNLICEANSFRNYQKKISNTNIIESNKSIDSYNYIANKVGVPDFTDLILNETITFNEFLDLRARKGASKFRLWLSQLQFDKESAIEDLLHEIPGNKKKDKVIKALRWAFSNAIGILEPISGITVSAIDSFIIDKLITGWNPNIYLNENLKIHLEKKISEKENIDKSLQIEKYFGKIGRNDKCPCNSGFKFKNCCGKI